MTEQKQNQFLEQEAEESDFNLYAIIFKYLVYWPLFLVSIFVCVLGTFVYLRYQTPVYNVKSAVLIKEKDKRSSNNSPLAAIQDLGMMSITNNFDNELEILKSQTLVKKVVSDLELYISHAKANTFSYSTPLYGNTPIKVYLTPEDAEKLQSGVSLKMEYDGKNNLDIDIEYFMESQKKKVTASFAALPAALSTDVGVFTFTPDTTIVLEKPVSLIAHVSTVCFCR